MMKMAINSRNKGNRAEREVAALLSDWTGKKFSRTPSSGGLQWKNTHVKGDIVCTEEGHLFPFCVEVKFNQEINFEELLVGSKKEPKILKFWDQCTRDAKLANKVPALFFRYNNLPKDFYFIILHTEHYKKIRMDQMLEGYGQDLFHINTKEYKLTLITTNTFFEFGYKKICKTLKPLIKKWRKETQQ